MINICKIAIMDKMWTSPFKLKIIKKIIKTSFPNLPSTHPILFAMLMETNDHRQWLGDFKMPSWSKEPISYTAVILSSDISIFQTFKKDYRYILYICTWLCNYYSIKLFKISNRYHIHHNGTFDNFMSFFYVIQRHQ